MTDTKKEGQILKTDVLGRVHTPKERREALLDEFEESGMSGKQFAGVIGVNYQTFACWAQKRRRERKEYPALPRAKASRKADSKVHWLEAVVEQKKLPAGSSRSVLVVQLPGGARMEVVDATQAMLAAALLRGLETKPALAC